MNKHFSLAVCAFCLLSACGGSPIATLSVTSLTFANQDVGATSAAQSVTLSNIGSATLNIASIAATTNFEQTNTCGASVRTGANCTISVTFTPPDAGDFTGTLSITDNANVSPQTVSLTGTGVTPTSCRRLGEICSANAPCCPGLSCISLGVGPGPTSQCRVR